MGAAMGDVRRGADARGLPDRGFRCGRGGV